MTQFLKESSHPDTEVSEIKLRDNKSKNPAYLFMAHSYDTTLHFAKFLPPRELSRIATINRLMGRIATLEELWQSHVHHFITETPKLSKGQNYKTFYIAAATLLREISKIQESSMPIVKKNSMRPNYLLLNIEP